MDNPTPQGTPPWQSPGGSTSGHVGPLWPTQGAPQGFAAKPHGSSDDHGEQYVAPKRRGRNQKSKLSGCGCMAMVAVVLVSLILIGGGLFASSGGSSGSSTFTIAFGNQVGVLRIEGPIMTSRMVMRQLSTIRRNPRIKALVVRIDSPGGSVGASEEIWREIRRFRDQTKMPVVMSMGNSAASGGYFVALAGDTIFANEGTITGSIGVIVQGLGFPTLLERFGLEERTIKSGSLKDSGSPLREFEVADRVYLQGVVNDMYRQFFRRVLEARWKQIDNALIRNPDIVDRVAPTDDSTTPSEGLQWQAFPIGAVANEIGATTDTENALRRVADGRVLTGEQAYLLGLVDHIGGLRDAAEEAAKQAGLAPGTFTINDPEPRPDLSWLFSSMLRNTLREGSREELQIEFR